MKISIEVPSEVADKMQSDSVKINGRKLTRRELAVRLRCFVRHSSGFENGDHFYCYENYAEAYSDNMGFHPVKIFGAKKP